MQKLESVDLASANASAVANFAKQIADLSTNASGLPQAQLDRAVTLTASLVARLRTNSTLLPRVLLNVTTAIGGLANVPPAQLSSASAEKLLSAITDVTAVLNATESGVVQATEYLALGSVARRSDSQQLGFSVPAAGSVRDARIRTGGGLPDARVEIRVRGGDVASGRVDFSLLRGGGLFRALQAGGAQEIVSHVIAARSELKDTAAERAPGHWPVQLVFAFSAPPNASDTPQCMFWNSTTRSWSGTGCRALKALSHRTRLACECSHLTNFALLFTPHGSPPPPEKVKAALMAVTYFLLPLSCFALLATILIYAVYMRHLKRSHVGNRNSYSAGQQAGRILVSLCAALLAGHVVFLAGGQHGEPGAGCTVIGALLHFCYLSAFAWSVVEGVNIFLSFVFLALSRDHLSVDVSRFFLKASVLAWGVPAAIVVITLSVNASGNYGVVSDLCFLRPTPFFYAFLAPLLLCLAVNLVVLALLLFALWRHGRSRLRERSKGSGRRVIGFVGICLLLNITWGIGAVQTAVPHEAVMFLFVIVNGLQGVLIFVFYCLLRHDVRHFVLKPLGSYSPASDQITSTSKDRSMSCVSVQTDISRRKPSDSPESAQELSDINIILAVQTEEHVVV